jgi:hypothetical protein
MSKPATDYEGLHYVTVEKTFQELGFTNIVLKEEQTTEKTHKNGNVSSITIDGDHFSSGDAFKPTDKVVIKYYKKKITIRKR